MTSASTRPTSAVRPTRTDAPACGVRGAALGPAISHRSGSANLNSAMGGSSGRQAGPRRAWREGVFDGQEVSAPYAAHPQPGVQAAGCIVHEALAALLLHVLPSGLQRIRHYRLLVNRMRHAKLERCRELLGVAPPAPNGQEPDEDYRDRCLRLTGGHCGPTAFAGGSVQLDRSPTRREPAPSRRTAFARPRWPGKRLSASATRCATAGPYPRSRGAPVPTHGPG